MKKLLSIVLALSVLISSLAFASSAFAAARPAQVKGVKGVIVVDRYEMTATYKLTWKKQSGVTGYQIKAAYPDYEGSGNYEFFFTKKIKGANKNSFRHEDVYMGDICFAYAKVRAYITKNGKTTYGKWSKIAESGYKVINQVTGFKGDTLSYRNGQKKLSFEWDKRKDADGYQIACYTYDGEQKKVTISGRAKTTYTGWFSEDTESAFIRYYKLKDGKKVFGDFSDFYVEFSLG